MRRKLSFILYLLITHYPKVLYLSFVFIFKILFLIHDDLKYNDTVTNEGYTHHNQAKTVSFWILHINDSCSKSPDHISPSIHDSCQLWQLASVSSCHVLMDLSNLKTCLILTGTMRLPYQTWIARPMRGSCRYHRVDTGTRQNTRTVKPVTKQITGYNHSIVELVIPRLRISDTVVQYRHW